MWPASLQDGFEAKLVGDGERGQFDYNPRRRTGIGDTLRDILNRCGAGQAGHDDGRAARDPAGVIGDRDIGQRKLGASCGVDVKADDAPPAFDEIAGDRASHDAKSDDSNGLVHQRSLPADRFASGAGRALNSW